MNEIRDRIKELRRVPAAELAPNPRNWRRHPEGQQQALMAVLNDIGYAGALLARETPKGLMLIDGHARAGLTPDAVVPVLVLDVTEAEADRILATYDPIAAMAERDAEAMMDLLDSIEIRDDDLLAGLFGHLGDEARTALRAISTEPKIGLTDPNDVPVSPEPRVASGELWLLGDHRVLCGDAMSAEDVGRLVDGAKMDVLWTDPPYGVDYEGKTNEKLKINNDREAGLAEFLRRAFQAADGVLAPGSPFYIAHPSGPLALVFGAVVKEIGWRYHQQLIWVKDSMVLGHSDYHYRHEPILYGWTAGGGRSGRGRHEGSRWFGDNAQTTVFEIDRPKASREHPTMKPVELVEKALTNSTGPDMAVFDPFLGSGSTLIAADRLGRRCYALELEPRYLDVAIRRWEEFTGQEAVRA